MVKTIREEYDLSDHPWELPYIDPWGEYNKAILRQLNSVF